MSEKRSERRVLRIGIAPREQIVQRTIAIASGKLKPAPDEPRTWFTSMESLAKVLSERNLLLVEMIRNAQPSSIAELAAVSGRAKSNLSRTLNRMHDFGLVTLEKVDGSKRPRVKYDSLEIVHTLGRRSPGMASAS